MFCILFNTDCKPSPEEKKKQDLEKLSAYLKEFRKLYAGTLPFYNKVKKLSEGLPFPESKNLVLKYKPVPALDLEMKTSNALWLLVGEPADTSNFSPNFKLTEIIPAGISTFAVNIFEGIMEKMNIDSLQLIGKDTSGLAMFAASMNTGRTPYVIFIRELNRENTKINESDFLRYSFDGGGILLAVWVADIDKNKILGSYLAEINAEKAYTIHSFKDTTSDKDKMEDMKLAIYREACFQAFMKVREDLNSAQKN